MRLVFLLFDIAGIAIFATLLGNSRARIAGLAAFALPLITFVAGLARPDDVSMESTWRAVGQWQAVTGLMGVVLTVGAVFALRDVRKPVIGKLEFQFARIASGVALVALVFGSVARGGMNLWAVREAAATAALLLGALAMSARFGTSPAGLVGTLGFLLGAADAGFQCTTWLNPEMYSAIPPVAHLAIYGIGSTAILAGFILASTHPALEQNPYPGVETLGMNRDRWIGLVMILGGSALFAFLALAIRDFRVLQGLGGRALVWSFVLFGLPLYGALRGAVRVTMGRPSW